MRVAELLDLLGSSVRACLGSEGRCVDAAAGLVDADAAGALSFCSFAGDEGLRLIQETAAAVVLSRTEVACGAGELRDDLTIIAVDNPRLAFIQLLSHRAGSTVRGGGVAESVRIAPTAHIGTDVLIGDCVVIGHECSVGDGTSIDAGAILYAGTRIGRNCRIQSGAVIGADGYGFERDHGGHLHRFPQLGRAIIEDEVEVGARTCVDRGALGDTCIGRGTKIDDGAYIAHNVRVGQDCLIMAHVVLCGSCVVGDGVEISPGAIIRERLSIGDNARIGLGAVVVKDVPEQTVVAGHPARPVEGERA